MNQSFSRRILIPIALACGLAVAGCSSASPDAPLKGAKIGGPFSLLDQDGKRVTDRDFQGKYRIVYFGYSHCPDICPTDLQKIGEGLARFEKKDPERGARVQPIFITVDPERDTPAALKPWVPSFHPRLVGLSGSSEQIAAVKKSYAIFSQKEAAQPGGSYAVNHTRLSYLMDPEGQPVALIPQESGADAIAAELDRWVK